MVISLATAVNLVEREAKSGLDGSALCFGRQDICFDQNALANFARGPWP